MPPVPTWLALPPAIASISGVIAVTSSSRTASGFRQQDQLIGACHHRNPGGQAIVVAEADLVGRDGIVFVDHRHDAEPEQGADRGTGVQVAPAALGIAERQQQLRRDQALAGEARLVGMGQIDLADRGGGLLVLKLEIARLEAEQRPAERDRARGHHDHLLAAVPAGGEILRQRFQPLVPQPPLVIDQQRRADLDDQAADGHAGIRSRAAAIVR
jgi:hypothetical protein